MTHTIHNLQQGSPEWLAYRQSHFNASEASAMLGMSSYQTRSELLKAKATGYTPEVDAQTQKRFDTGHAAEVAARPFAEGIIEQDLYPITASRDALAGSTLLPLSASYDGATMGEDVVWEHKIMNENLHESLSRSIIPDQYRPQLEQQLMVIGAEKVLFMATSLDQTAAEYVWYTSNPELRQRLLAGWAQFAADLANYQHTPTPTADWAPVGRTPETLPALRIEVTGMVTTSNMAAFKGHALAVFAEINRDLVTEQDFASAEATSKWCGEVEIRLAAAKQHALSQTESIDALFRTIDEISTEARTVRLELDKLVKNRKESIRAEIVSDGRNALANHMDALIERIGGRYLPSIAVDFAAAIKGKRTLDSMRDAVDTELARAKIEANAVADKIQINMAVLSATGHFAFLFPDVATLVLKQPDDLTNTITARVAQHEAKEAARIEAERERIRAEEAARASAEIERANREAMAKLEQAYRNGASGTAAISRNLVPAENVAVSNVATLPVRALADTGLMMRLGGINALLAPIAITAEGLLSLGFAHAATDKAAKLYRQRDFELICAALVNRINQVQASHVDLMRVLHTA